MRKNHAVIALTVIPFLALAACGSQDSDSSMSPKASSSAQAMMKSSDKAMDKGGMQKEGMDKEGMQKEGMEKAGRFISYDDYSSSMMKEDGAMEGTTVLFFDASWCPDCQALKKKLSSDSSVIPDGVTVVDVDYDSHSDLRQKYGVTMQHTFVQVDASGNAIESWNSTNADDLAQALAKLAS